MRARKREFEATDTEKWTARFARQLLWAELTVRFVRSFYIDWAPFGKKSLSVQIYGIAGWSLFSFFFYCGNGDAIGTSVSVRYIVDVRSSGVVVKRGSTVCAINQWDP